jgi:hypothetical protein
MSAVVPSAASISPFSSVVSAFGLCTLVWKNRVGPQAAPCFRRARRRWGTFGWIARGAWDSLPCPSIVIRGVASLNC